ncbi:MAG: hypothetical protein JOZ52_03970 [Acidobacteria bacterium]|nr:hypothetical protein [Acidobacteriota bacterium]
MRDEVKHKRFLLFMIALVALVTMATLWPALGQKRSKRAQQKPAVTTRRTPPPTTRTATPVPEQPLDGEKLDEAMGVICAARGRDALGSTPIDVMQSRASLELNHPEAVIGAQRARRLLPVAKELMLEALRLLATENKIDTTQLRAAAKRVREVTDVTPDPDLRDNAAVIMNDTHTIRFGTIFLVGLPSDEGMMSVLSHELTHIADGRQNSLQTLFNLIGKKASRLTGLRVNGQKPEELTCDLIGERAARLYIARTPNNESRAARLARTLEHNCVDDDETDEEHLSPRSTMRAVLALDPTLARELLAQEDKAAR